MLQFLIYTYSLVSVSVMVVHLQIYTASNVKHHPYIISETFFICYFLQMKNQFVILVTQVFP